jgi:hypothetical protein
MIKAWRIKHPSGLYFGKSIWIRIDGKYVKTNLTTKGTYYLTNPTEKQVRTWFSSYYDNNGGLRGLGDFEIVCDIEEANNEGVKKAKEVSIKGLRKTHFEQMYNYALENEFVMSFYG